MSVLIFICIVVIIGFMLLLYMIREAHLNRVLEMTMHIKDLPACFNDFSIYFISDIHRRALSEDMLKQVQQPDIVVIGGDLMEEGVPFSRVQQNVEKLTQFGVPILFVWGNHDLYVNRDRLEEILKNNGVTLLENNVYTYVKNGHKLNLIGVGDATNDLDRLDEALKFTKEGIRVLLSHNPKITEKINKEDRIPLVLSGHTHGGQIRLFGWGIRQKGGVWPKDFGTLIISNGYGTTSYPLRLGAPPDSLLIHLQAK